jgi:hypothetical protein
VDNVSQYPYGQPPSQQPYGSPQQPSPPGYERPYQQQGLPPQNPFGPYRPQQGYRPQPPPRRRHTLRNVLLGTLGGVVALGVIGAALSGGNGSGSTAGSGATQAVSAPASSAPASPAAATAAPAPRPAAPHVIATFSASGIENTAKFTVPANWTLHWSYNCSAFGQAGNFAVLEDGGADFGGATVNELGTAGHGITHAYGDSGSHYLEVDSECAWSMQVVG